MARRFLVSALAAVALATTACTAPTQGGGAPPPSTSQTWAETMLALVNAERDAAGVAPLRWCGALGRAAQAHSQDQAAHNAMSHVGSDGSSFVDRAQRGGYVGWSALAENVAAGYANVSSVMRGWMNSPGHRNNILGGAYTDFGAGFAVSDSGYPYWTQNFGRNGTC